MLTHLHVTFLHAEYLREIQAADNHSSLSTTLSFPTNYTQGLRVHCSEMLIKYGRGILFVADLIVVNLWTSDVMLMSPSRVHL